MWRWLAGLLMIAGADASTGTLLPPVMMSSTGAGPMVVTVWLPPDYDAARERYPVVYMQDGQNVFDAASRATSWNRRSWGADTVAAELIAARKVPAFIIVAIDHKGQDRGRQYYPQAAFSRLDPARQRHMTELPPYSDAYLGFLVGELKPLIDARFRTRSEAASTFVLGSSMGGLISLYAFAEYPHVFGGAGCLSTHWPMAAAGPSEPDEILFSAFEEYLRDKGLRPGRLWFDHGTLGLDATYGPFQNRIDELLQSQSWRSGVDFISRTYPGGDHNEEAWRARLGDVLQFLLRGN